MATPSSLTPLDTEAFQRLAADVDAAIAAAERLDAQARRVALDLKTALERFHQVGLTTIVRALKGDANGRELLFDLVDDPTVRALLSLHGLIRPPAESEAAAPPPAPHAQPPNTRPPAPAPIAAVIPLSALRSRPAAAGWTRGPALDDIDEDRPFRLDARDTSVVLVRTGGGAQAFRNECAHQGLPLDGGRIDRESGTLTCPWHGFRFDCVSGECLTAPHVQLEAIPVRVDAGVVYVRLA